MMLVWRSSKFAQLYKLSLYNKTKNSTLPCGISIILTLGSEYLPWPSASGNIPTFMQYLSIFHAEVWNIYSLLHRRVKQTNKIAP